jgi:transposase
VEQALLSETERLTQFDQLSREELIQRHEIMRDEIERLIRENYALRQIQISDDQITLMAEEQIRSLTETIYGASSERFKKPGSRSKPKKKDSPKPRIKKPSERYPNVPVREISLTIDPAPTCDACGEQMSESGMTEDSQQLTVIPKKFEILRTRRAIYRCVCHSCMKTAPVLPRIIEGSSYSDEMILDVVLSKYCDLIPMDRYVQMASRGGVMDLPPNSLIDLTHKFAFFVSEVYRLIRADILKARVLSADETPHRMLEGSQKKSWYLWGFSTLQSCFLECRDTRSGNVASEILLSSACETLLTDVYSGYGKALKVVNLDRQKNSQLPIESAYCNAHARRYFFKPRVHYPEANFYLEHYHEIYRLNAESKGLSPPEILAVRKKMEPHFLAMKSQAIEGLSRYPRGNQYGKALGYFVENYEGLTLFLTEPDVAIDNNAQERLLRSHVVGRKTWYGTHSEQGAETAAILFSIVETCKLNDVNPRVYFADLVQMILNRRKVLTPAQWKNSRSELA